MDASLYYPTYFDGVQVLFQVDYVSAPSECTYSNFLLIFQFFTMSEEAVQFEVTDLSEQCHSHQESTGCPLNNSHIWELHRTGKIEGNLNHNRTDIMSSPWETHGITPARNPQRLAGYISTI